MEYWKAVVGYEYEVSSFGRVRNKITKNVLTNLDKNRLGYLRVVLFKDHEKKRFFIHRLVATAFIPNLENKPQVNHKDGNKQNNNLENLEWVTRSENGLHSYYVLKNKTGFAYGFGDSKTPWNKGKTNLKETSLKFIKRAGKQENKGVIKMYKENGGKESSFINGVKRTVCEVWTRLKCNGILPTSFKF